MAAHLTSDELIYVGMCYLNGTQEEIASRREIMDIMELFNNEKSQRNSYKQMYSGSFREGFRLATDVDEMLWLENHKVVWNLPQAKTINIFENDVIFCYNTKSPPGFTLLILPFESTDSTVSTACLQTYVGLCLSSSLYRTLISSDTGSTTHGPCVYDALGHLEFDSAYCFASDFWPPLATSWIERCRCHSWPPSQIVRKIVRNGCHFVAIGHRQGIQSDHEWRISFSRAEYILAKSLDHPQFLTYCLLKVILSEVINKGLGDEDKLLCSYYMKTAVFWVIQENAQHRWSPQNLLSGFWLCFKLLIKWVYEGVCPNFFIPENNMFLGKIHGSPQAHLFNQLNSLYETGIDALLQLSPSINEMYRVCERSRFKNNTLISETMLKAMLLHEIGSVGMHGSTISDLQSFMKTEQTLEQLICLPLTHNQIFWLRKRVVSMLHSAAFIVHSIYTGSVDNRRMYIADKVSWGMLKLAGKWGSISDMSYICMYLYKTFRYRKALPLIRMLLSKLTQLSRNMIKDMDLRTLGENILSYRFRQAVVTSIVLVNKITYIEELILEQQSSVNKCVALTIPTDILFLMLEFLCCMKIDKTRAHEPLLVLQEMLEHNHEEISHDNDISWEILGICQQLIGNLNDAFCSFTQSLSETPIHCIQNATNQRIRMTNQHNPFVETIYHRQEP